MQRFQDEYDDDDDDDDPFRGQGTFDDAEDVDDGDAQDDGEHVPQGAVDFKPSTTLGTRETEPPWHMWGSSEIITTPPLVIALGVQQAKAQLTKVNYKRPETWHWMFSSRLISAPSPVALQPQSDVIIVFDVTIGIGRTVIYIPGFETHRFVANNPGVFVPGMLLRTNVVNGDRSYTDNAGVITVDRTIIDEVVAQDINVTARVLFLSAVAGQQASVEVTSMWAPKNHIRPDWFIKGHEETLFQGAETGGR